MVGVWGGWLEIWGVSGFGGGGGSGVEWGLVVGRRGGGGEVGGVGEGRGKMCRGTRV